MKDFSFNLSTRIEFGKGYVTKAGEIIKEFGAQKVIVITDKGLIKAGIVAKVTDSLQASGVEYIIYDGVQPNPKDVDCIAAGDMAREYGADFVVAIGGGSSMDTAKAVAALITNPVALPEIMKPYKVPIAPAPLLCVPTTAGTGSEVTSFSVITLTEEQRKSCMFDDKLRPEIALIDPELLLGVPGPIIASTGIDALTHAIEAYTCKLATPITDAFALHAIRYIGRSLRTLMYERTYESAEEMMMASLMAGIAFGFSDIASVHALAEAIGGYYDTPHGVANSIFLPVVFEYDIPANVEKHKDVALALDIDPVGKSDREIAQAAVEWIETLSKDVGIPTLKELGYIEPERFEQFADVCMINVSTPSNARAVDKQAYIDLFKKTYKK